MQAKVTDAVLRDAETEEELAGILTAISIVSKRLAKKLNALQLQVETSEEGGTVYEQAE